MSRFSVIIVIVTVFFYLVTGCAETGFSDWGFNYVVEGDKVLVCEVRPDSPAARARIIGAPPGYLLVKNIGLAANLDYIISLDGRDIAGDTARIEEIRNHKQPGDRVTIRVDRMGTILILEMNL